MKITWVIILFLLIPLTSFAEMQSISIEEPINLYQERLQNVKNFAFLCTFKLDKNGDNNPDGLPGFKKIILYVCENYREKDREKYLYEEIYWIDYIDQNLNRMDDYPKYDFIHDVVLYDENTSRTWSSSNNTGIVHHGKSNLITSRNPNIRNWYDQIGGASIT